MAGMKEFATGVFTVKIETYETNLPNI